MVFQHTPSLPRHARGRHESHYVSPILDDDFHRVGSASRRRLAVTPQHSRSDIADGRESERRRVAPRWLLGEKRRRRRRDVCRQGRGNLFRFRIRTMGGISNSQIQRRTARQQQQQHHHHHRPIRRSSFVSPRHCHNRTPSPWERARGERYADRAADRCSAARVNVSCADNDDVSLPRGSTRRGSLIGRLQRFHGQRRVRIWTGLSTEEQEAERTADMTITLHVRYKHHESMKRTLHGNVDFWTYGFQRH